MFCYFYIFSIINHSFGEMNHYNSRNWDQKSPKKMISRKSLGIFSLIKLIWKSTIASVKSKRRCWELLMNNTYKKVFLWKEKNMKEHVLFLVKHYGIVFLYCFLFLSWCFQEFFTRLWVFALNIHVIKYRNFS